MQISRAKTWELSSLENKSKCSSADVLAFGVFYDFYYLGELLLVTLQTIMIMYLRRSRLVLGIPKLKFWLFGLMYYNCSGKLLPSHF